MPVSEQSQNALSADETSFIFTEQNAPNAKTGQSTGTVWVLVRMVLVLAAVVGCIYAVVFFLKKGLSPKNSSDPYLKKVSSLVLAPGKSVHVITLGSKAYIVGASENAVNLLVEVDDKELVDAMNLYSEPDETQKPRDFSTLLAAFSGLKKKKQSVSETSAAAGMTFSHMSSAAGEAEQMIKNQRERLNKINTEEFR